MERLIDFVFGDKVMDFVLTASTTAAFVFGIYVIGHIIYAVTTGAF